MHFTFEDAWKLALGAISLALGWLHFQREKEIAEMKRAIAEAERKAEEAQKGVVQVAFEAGRALAEHKLYAAETYAPKREVERGLEKVEERLSEQLTAQSESTLERLAEIRDRLPRRN